MIRWNQNSFVVNYVLSGYVQDFQNGQNSILNLISLDLVIDIMMYTAYGHFFILLQAVYSIPKSSLTMSRGKTSWNLVPVCLQKQAEITNGWFTRTCVDVDEVWAKIWPVAPGLEVKCTFFGRTLGWLTFLAECVGVFSHKASSLCWLSSRSPPWLGQKY